MTARAEVEDILEEAIWRERNGLDPSPAIEARRSPALTEAQRLRAYEVGSFRDWPGGDAYDSIPVFSRGWLIGGMVCGALLSALVIGWALTH